MTFKTKTDKTPQMVVSFVSGNGPALCNSYVIKLEQILCSANEFVYFNQQIHIGILATITNWRSNCKHINRLQRKQNFNLEEEKKEAKVVLAFLITVSFVGDIQCIIVTIICICNVS